MCICVYIYIYIYIYIYTHNSPAALRILQRQKKSERAKRSLEAWRGEKTIQGCFVATRMAAARFGSVRFAF